MQRMRSYSDTTVSPLDECAETIGRSGPAAERKRGHTCFHSIGVFIFPYLFSFFPICFRFSCMWFHENCTRVPGLNSFDRPTKSYCFLIEIWSCIPAATREGGPGIENWSHDVKNCTDLNSWIRCDQILLVLYRELVMHNLPRPERGLLV